ncbi:MAG: hypothetical protein ACLFR2_03415 [Candidatus Kapaibacterium sp.]
MHRLNGIGCVYSAIIIVLISVSAAAESARYELPCESRLLEASLDTALSQCGIIEEKGNRGEPAKYLAAAGLPEGYPWCAAGVYWCFMRAAEALGMGLDKIPFRKTAVANEIYNDFKKKGKRTEFHPRRHDLIV